MAEHRHIVIDNGQKNVGRQVFAVGRREIGRPALCRVTDHMHDQPHKAIDKVFPTPRFAVEAAIEQVAIDFR
jgi:hypothetical protein